jgi:hypothetical protein
MSVQQLFSDWAAIGSQLTRVVDYVIVDSTAKLPQPVSGVITLEDNTTYFFTTTIDLNGSRLVCGQNTTILGGSSENCRIKSTGLTGTALITSAWSLPIRSIAFESDIVFNLNANGNANQALDWFGVNVIDSNTVGTIANYTNFIASDCGFLNTQGLTFDGSVGTIGFAQTIFDCKAGGTSIIIPSTATITRRFRIIYSAFVILSGETGINVSSSATIPVEGYILDTVNFSGGGTYTTGVAYTDNKALFSNNRGINNSAEIAYYTMNNNATATTVASSGVAYKVAGTTTSQSVTQKFTNTNNRATYTGAITRAFSVSAVLSCTSGNNNQIGLYIAKNGAILTESEVYITTGGSGRAEGGKIQAILQLVTNDYIEIFVENSTTATNITVTELSVIVEALS